MDGVDVRGYYPWGPINFNIIILLQIENFYDHIKVEGCCVSERRDRLWSLFYAKRGYFFGGKQYFEYLV